MVGRAPSAICAWRKEPSWKKSGLPDKPPYDVVAVRAWMGANLSRTPEDAGHGEEGVESDDLTTARIKNFDARTAKIELEKAILAGDYVKRGDVMRAWAGRVALVRSAFEAIPKRLDSLFAAIPGAERIRRELELEIRGILDAFARGDAAPAKVADALLALERAVRAKDRAAVRSALEKIELVRGTISKMES